MKDYSIWVLEYAYVPDYPVGAIIYGAHNEGVTKLPYCYALVRGNGHNILVDVGFNYRDYGQTLAEQVGVVNWRDPATVLSEAGVTPEDIDTVIITHAHFDHFGNVMDFPNATFYIQEREISKWMWAMTLPEQFGWVMTAVDPGDIVRGAELAKEGRMIMVDGDQEGILPGIDVFVAHDSHTFASQFVRINNADGGWILAGDLAYKYDNITGRDHDGVYLPVGLACGSQLNLLLATDRMMDAVDRDSGRIIPVHEQRLTEFFPNRKTREGLNIIEVTLSAQEESRI